MASKVRSCKWIGNGINGFLLDVFGVLYDAGSSDIPIAGSVEAVKKYVYPQLVEMVMHAYLELEVMI